ncbi:t-SNARE, partial [Mycotypha africana]|uniref:t-SNARE n=1 Tax=Mycotypha africana TaxID=64632 RepID=UPI002300F8D2
HEITTATRELIKDAMQDLKALSSFQTTDKSKAHKRRLEQQKISKDLQNITSTFQTLQKVLASQQRESVNRVRAAAVMLEARSSAEVLRSQQKQIPNHALDQEVEYNQSLIADREIEIENIENGITELNEIFRNMSMLVNEQESGIQSIYGNILNIAQNTRQAADELIIASRHQRNTFRNMCLFLIIITIVGSMLALIIIAA